MAMKVYSVTFTIPQFMMPENATVEDFLRILRRDILHDNDLLLTAQNCSMSLTEDIDLALTESST
jgi:hypothetical protein